MNTNLPTSRPKCAAMASFVTLRVSFFRAFVYFVTAAATVALASQSSAQFTQTFTVNDRPSDPMISSYGFATGLVVPFSNTTIGLMNPTTTNPNASIKVIDGGTAIQITLKPGFFIQPVSPAAAVGPNNQITFSVDTLDGGATPNEYLWTAPVTNVVPRAQSGETVRDSEPSIAFNPNPGYDAFQAPVNITTFSGNWGAANNAPMWISRNSGLSWSQSNSIPQASNGGVGPEDQTLAYNPSGSRLYGAFMGSVPTTTRDMFNVRSTDNPLTTNFSATNYSSLNVANSDVDQPWIKTGSPDATGNDRVFVGVNDFVAAPNTASVYFGTRNTITGNYAINPITLENSATVVGQDSPAVRVAVTGNTVYAAFQRYTAAGAGRTVQGDIVITRDNNNGANNFNDDNAVVGTRGTVVAAGVTLPRINSNDALTFHLGADNTAGQRLGSDLSIAVRPDGSAPASQTVYLAYDVVNGGGTRADIVVRRSTDGGATFAAAPVLTVQNAALPSLAVLPNGVWALEYMRVTPANGGNPARYSEEIVQADSLGVKPAQVLESWNVTDAANSGINFLGDYDNLIAVGDKFYATYSGNGLMPGGTIANLSDNMGSDFPLGVVYQRNGDFPNMQLLDGGGANVANSIDPYFVMFQAIPEPASCVLFALGLAGFAAAAWRHSRRRN